MTAGITATPVKADTASGFGEAQQRQWLQSLERDWLRSWQQASPLLQGPDRAMPTGSDADGCAAAGSAATVGQRAAPAVADASVERRPGTAAASLRGGDASAAGIEFEAVSTDGFVAQPGGSTPAVCTSVRATGAANRVVAHGSMARHVALARPAAASSSSTSLHVRGSDAGEVMVAMRDVRLDAGASSGVAEALARRLALAGYARVQVYVNGTARRSDACDAASPSLEPDPSHDPGEPTAHGH